MRLGEYGTPVQVYVDHLQMIEQWAEDLILCRLKLQV